MALQAINASGLAFSTKNTYAGTLRLLGQLLEFDPTSLLQFRARMYNVEDSYDLIKGRWPDPVTRIRVVTTILTAIRLTGTKLRKDIISTWKHIHWVLVRNSARRNGSFSHREELSWVPFREIVAKRNELGDEDYGSMQHLFLSWYTMWPPNRADFYKTLIFRDEKEVPPFLRRWMYFRGPTGNGTVKSRIVRPTLKRKSAELTGGGGPHVTITSRDPQMPMVNFIVLKPSTPREWFSSVPKPSYVSEWDVAPRLILMSHKTAGSHGRLLRSIPSKLVDVLKASLQDNPRRYLFVRNDGEPFTNSHSFTVWGERLLAKLFEGRRLGFNGLRHSYISNVNFNETSAQQLRTLARDMGHSEFQQRRYVRGNFASGRAPVLMDED